MSSQAEDKISYLPGRQISNTLPLSLVHVQIERYQSKPFGQGPLTCVTMSGLKMVPYFV